MTTFDELDQYLEGNYNQDFWSDYAVLQATKLIANLDKSGWISLLDNWRERPVSWQVKLADALFDSGGLSTVDLLCDMLKSPEVSVALASAESLSAMDDVWTPNPELRKDLERLLTQLDSKDRLTIENILERIPQD